MFFTWLLPSGRLCAFSGAGTGVERYCDNISIAAAREGARLQLNIDDTVPLFTIKIQTVSAYAIPFAGSGIGIWGVFPFVKVIPCNKADGSLIGGGVIFRNSVNRRKYITLQNGYVTDPANTYALEIA